MSIPKPIFYVPVHGTWDLGKDAWWRFDSAFHSQALDNNVFTKTEIEPFEWCGSLDGVHGTHNVWNASGFSLRHYLKQFHVFERNLIVHSHGLQVAAYCNMRINNIISIGSPIRADMFLLYNQLRFNCNRWLHIYDMAWDKMGFLGQFGDGRWFGSRHCDYAHENLRLKKIGHSSILRDEVNLKLWINEGLYDFLRK